MKCPACNGKGYFVQHNGEARLARFTCDICLGDGSCNALSLQALKDAVARYDAEISEAASEEFPNETYLTQARKGRARYVKVLNAIKP